MLSTFQSRPGFRDIKLKGAVPEIVQPGDCGCDFGFQSAKLRLKKDQRGSPYARLTLEDVGVWARSTLSLGLRV